MLTELFIVQLEDKVMKKVKPDLHNKICDQTKPD